MRSLIIKRFIGKVVTMSKQKYASNVFEKCLVFSSYDETQKIINEVLTIAKVINSGGSGRYSGRNSGSGPLPLPLWGSGMDVAPYNIAAAIAGSGPQN